MYNDCYVDVATSTLVIDSQCRTLKSLKHKMKENMKMLSKLEGVDLVSLCLCINENKFAHLEACHFGEREYNRANYELHRLHCLLWLLENENKTRSNPPKEFETSYQEFRDLTRKDKKEVLATIKRDVQEIIYAVFRI